MSKLEDYCINITDGEHGTVKDVQASEFFLLSNKNIKNSKIYIDNSDRTISQADYEIINKRTKIEHEDVVVATVGTIGKTAVLDNPSNYVFQRSVGIIKTNKKILNPYYLKYQIDAPYFQKRLQLLSKGGVQKCIFINDLKKLEVNIPPIKEQEEIVLILKNIDSKIENNNAIISELESMAKDIYDYWFVQFDFPDENGKPYKSSGGKMVWNEELKREIPEGWKADKLGSIVSVITNRINAEQIGHRKYIPIEVIPRNKMSFYETADIDKAATGLCSFNKGAILLSNRRVYFHKVSISPFDGVTRDTVIIMEAQKDNLGYAYQIVNSDHFINYATRFSYGTEQPVLSTPSALAYDISCPNNAVDLKYSRFVAPLIEKVLSLEHENAELTSLRDFLLPLLMNGQVKIGDIEA